MAVIGETLTAPETGWKRYDLTMNTTMPQLTFVGAWTRSTSDSGGTNWGEVGVTSSIELNASLKFKFRGTKLRMISKTQSFSRSNNIEVKVDGVVVGNYSLLTGATTYQVLVYELLGLEDGIHEVEFTNKDTTDSATFVVDAVDIDDGGRLMHVDEVLSPDQLAVGKRIRLNYFNTVANTVGTFTLLGEESGDFLPQAAISTPNGDAYFIAVDKDHADRWILIADRNIQSLITWQTLNDAGFATNEGVPLQFIDAVPKLTDYSGANGQVISNGFYNGGSAYYPWKVFDKTNAGNANRWSVAGQSGYIGYKFNKPKKLYAYGLTPAPSGTVVDWKTGMPMDWTFEGSNDGTNWEILDTQTGVTDWVTNVEKQFNISAPQMFTYYRVNVLINNGGSYVTIGEVRFLEQTLENYEFAMRMPISGADASTLTDLDNEWDRYINSPLIPASDWNFAPTSIYSWTASQTRGSMNNRITRGGPAASGFVARATTSSIATIGWRPVLTIDTMLTSRYLIRDNGVLKRYVNSWEVITEELTADLIRQQGMSTFNALYNNAEELESDNIEILAWSSDAPVTRDLSVSYVPAPQVVPAARDFSLGSISIDLVKIQTAGTTGVVRMAVSIDSGVTWRTFDTGGWTGAWSWKDIDKNDLAALKSLGMSPDRLNAITRAQWDRLFEGVTDRTIRFLYYIEAETATQVVAVDELTIQGDVPGKWKKAAHGVDFDYEMINNTLYVELYQSADYKINY